LGENFTQEFIMERIGFDLIADDPETKFYHPAEQLSLLMQLADKSYNKSKSDVNSLLAAINKEEFIELFNSGKCNSFREFFSYFPFAELN